MLKNEYDKAKKEVKETKKAIKQLQMKYDALLERCEQMETVKENAELAYKTEKDNNITLKEENTQFLVTIREQEILLARLRSEIDELVKEREQKLRQKAHSLRVKVFILGVWKIPEELREYYDFYVNKCIDENNTKQVLESDEIWALNTFITIQQQRILAKINQAKAIKIKYFENMSEMNVYAEAHAGGIANGIQ